MPAQGHLMLRSQVSEWNEPWTAGDRARVTAALEAIPDGKCRLASAGNCIVVWMNDLRALIIYPNYLAWPGKPWPGKRWTKDLLPDLFTDMHENQHDQWYELSTFQQKGT